MKIHELMTILRDGHKFNLKKLQIILIYHKIFYRMNFTILCNIFILC